MSALVPSRTALLHALTNFGDSAVLLPLSLVILGWLMTARPANCALAWAGVLIGCNVLIGLLKIYFFACPGGPALHSPSGHTGFSVLVYGALALIVTQELRRPWQKAAVACLGAAFVVAIALSRVALGMHSTTEIALGGAIGGAGLWIFALFYRKSRGRSGSMLSLGLIVLVVATLFHGSQLRIEGYLHSVSLRLGIGHAVCSSRAP
jgi:membrane-associated phospholipid phosphatase